MPFRTVEVMRDEAAVEQRLQLCRFTEDVYPTWDILNSLTFRRRMLILGAGKLAGELSRAVLSQRFGLVEIIGALVGKISDWSGAQAYPA